VIIADLETIFADLLTLVFSKKSFYPGSHRLSRLALNDTTKSTVTAVATLLSQLLGTEVALFSNSLMIEVDKVMDAQIVDIGIIGHALTGEILAEIVTVGTNGLSELGES
jgi:hypothetical protein